MSRPAYYNENDPDNVKALRNLMAAGLIARGFVDDRSIEDVRPDDLREFGQLHFFAGHGIWSYAARLAGIPDSFPLVSGSCPCQPFSAAGAGNGLADERHLWPAFWWLLAHRAQRGPVVVVGEQVASKDAEPWLDVVYDDLEALGFTVGAVAFPAASVGAPHIRDRTYWVAHTDDAGLQGRPLLPERAPQFTTWAGRVAHEGREPLSGFWRAADWLQCSDGAWRPVEPGAFPLAARTPADVDAIHAYGNAINAQAARVFLDCVRDAGVLL
jgi:DNA (cytosine-5)-methyltransferase 1